MVRMIFIICLLMLYIPVKGHPQYIRQISPAREVLYSTTYTQSGWWGCDPAEPDGRVWMLPTYYIHSDSRWDNMREYASESNFRIDSPQRSISPQYGLYCDGTGHAVYQGYFYCVRRNTRNIVKTSLTTYRRSFERELPFAGFRNTYPYSSGVYTDIDLQIDNGTLWAIYATPQSNGNIVISSLDMDGLYIIKTWNTSFLKRSAGDAFIVSGVLYALSHNNNPTHIQYIYDTNIGVEDFLREDELVLPGPHHGFVSMMSYIPNTGHLYVWDSYYRRKYPISLTDDYPSWHPWFGLSTTPTPIAPTQAPTPAPTELPRTNQTCSCEFRIKTNASTCPDGTNECSNGFPVHTFPEFGYTVVDDCKNGCDEVMRQCPQECTTNTDNVWGKDGLASVIPGREDKPLGQAFCERIQTTITGPGAIVLGTVTYPRCEFDLINKLYDERLCCIMYRSPIIGSIPIWDHNCDGKIETAELKLIDKYQKTAGKN